MDAFLYLYPEIREQNSETGVAFPHFPRKSGAGPCQGSLRAFHSIFITAHAPSKRELGGHPVSQRSRGMQMRAGSQCAPLHLVDLRGLGGKRTRTDTRFVAFSHSNRINMPVRTRARAPARREPVAIERRRIA